MDTKKWFSETSRQRVTDGMIADILNVTRKTANKRINDGLPMNDLVTISRALEINPVITLVELGHLTHDEIENYLDSDGQLIATADEGTLSIELARRLNPATLAPEIYWRGGGDLYLQVRTLHMVHVGHRFHSKHIWCGQNAGGAPESGHEKRPPPR